MLDVNRKKFVIFTHYRSGSRSLLEILRAQNLVVFDEPFNFAHCFDNNDEMDRTYHTMLQKSTADEVYQNIFKKYDGFKHIFLQIDEENNKTLLAKYPVIFLLRKNQSLAALSFLVAQQTRIWHATKRSKTMNIWATTKDKNLSEIYASLPPIEIDKLYKTIEMYQRIHSYEAHMKNYIKVFYEDLYSSNWKSVCQTIFDFLDVKEIDWSKVEPIVSPDNKLNNEEYFKQLVNYKQILQAIRPLY